MKPQKRRMWRVGGWLAISLLLSVAMVLASCDVSRFFSSKGDFVVAVKNPLAPNATYVGMSTCSQCHKKVVAGFPGSVHEAFAIRESADEEFPTGEGCESCHGPGSAHVMARGTKPGLILKGDFRACFACHLDKEMDFTKRYHHPVPEGRMSCADCHDPHSGTKTVFRAEAINDKCFKCHPDKKGPFAFAHDAVTEDGCSACHNPHGSNTKKLLQADEPNVCLRCHFDAGRHPNVGRFSHHGGAYLNRGCTNCHTGIHGSNFNKSLRHP